MLQSSLQAKIIAIVSFEHSLCIGLCLARAEVCEASKCRQSTKAMSEVNSSNGVPVYPALVLNSEAGVAYHHAVRMPSAFPAVGAAANASLSPCLYCGWLPILTPGQANQHITIAGLY